MNWRLGVVGSPIAHSLSPAMHVEGLRLAGLEGSSEPLEMGLEDASGMAGLLPARFDALSVTMPLKGVAYGACDSVDDVAARTGSVNSLAWRDGRLLGASTDGRGLLDALAGQFAESVEDAHVVVLGAGGAARAIVDGLVFARAATVSVHGRTEANVEAITSRYANVFDYTHEVPVDVIVNTVPVHGRARDSLLKGVSSSTIAIDITYEPRVSAWRALYEEAGCRTANGLAMLAYQAALQLAWWWGVTIDGAQLLAVVS